METAPCRILRARQIESSSVCGKNWIFSFLKNVDAKKIRETKRRSSWVVDDILNDVVEVRNVSDTKVGKGNTGMRHGW